MKTKNLVADIFKTEIPKQKEVGRSEGLRQGFYKGVIVGAMLGVYAVFAVLTTCLRQDKCSLLLDVIPWISIFFMLVYIVFVSALLSEELKSWEFKKVYFVISVVFGVIVFLILFINR
ncbi:hypothetical protein A2803_00230 [Candidatus Woesebacteria bacterium RIFCSPHIGHO2_01_FULL_44_21]|uniref:Uncharacterized protein n=1 Tax=Candidatus Woesebacteria bacterium RIFCSPHIGHO2_01_FULL_44_21 TaxID=1802503 RepID=A0A1F7Z2I8_9BACT|nr:MAG: hypothetical protein A2803_00230 [Candidatus Woesebacteria bacterium RIFCSPHIGHO2_01_FULL_44_21]OGM70579.1 MAG: hypothetical protein A2897_02125 [Candidatus Woesebacteria bacterium RIFCSPLOWO2_01_FULL_44_24b]